MVSLAAWVGRLPRPRGRQEWLEHLALFLALLFAIAGLGALIAGYLVLAAAVQAPWPAWRPQVLILGGFAGVGLFLLCVLAILSRTASPRVLGPVLYYDLIRSARRARYFLIRALYAATLLGILCLFYHNWTLAGSSGHAVSSKDASAFAGYFFALFMSVQFLVVTLVTPAYTAGAIADEKERQTLQFLLATDLHNREIVLSKLLSRVFHLVLLMLTGLPVLGALQLLGGVEPLLVIAGFAATLVTITSLAGLSIYNSTLCRRGRDAIVLTYLMALTYLALSGLSWLLTVPTGWEDFPANHWPTTPFKLLDVVEVFNAGNIFSALWMMQEKMGKSGGISDPLMAALRNYSLFHAVIALGAPIWAIVRLRSVALQEATQARRRGLLDPRGTGLTGPSRPVGNLPVLWKELVAESGLRLNLAGRLVVGLLIPLSFVPAILVASSDLQGDVLIATFTLFIVVSVPLVLLTFEARRGRWLRTLLNILFLGFLLLFALVLRQMGEGRMGWGGWGQMSEGLNVLQVRGVGTGVACLLLLAVAVRASGSISGERDRQTLDALLTTPEDSDTILVGKWLGAVLSVRRGWLWLGGIWGFGVVSGALHPLALPFLVVTWFVYAAFVALLGLWFSMNCSTTVRATTWTLVGATGLALGHWLLWFCCLPILFMGGSDVGDFLGWIASLQAGLTPPAVLGGLLPFHPESLVERTGSAYEVWEMIAFAVLGTICWGGLTVWLWVATSVRFRELTSRSPLARPEANDRA